MDRAINAIQRLTNMDTPETDALYERLLKENPGNYIYLEEFLELARKLERERDEWAAMCGRYKQERDEAHLDKRGG
jgi:hypothetical protein